ncbi:RES domain-containing protein [Luteimonas sp. SX5]|uniref:RES domain-containing protein n=1 Tax=Luteimonas galliterrae TaxID=2940486 RepID=A0ABT0MDX0_9GAMM|nr:RES domain-containing protein [Luteimonas galliterrae]MCL1633066.1 RES domain-containing protein [Luteimonas galliterrae]
MSYDSRICGDCISDAFLKAEIAKSARDDEECSYCSKIKPTIEMNDLAERVDNVISLFFESTTGDELPWANYEPTGNPLDEVVGELLGAEEDVVNDVVELLSEGWFDRDSLEKKYGDDPHFVENTRFEQPLSEAWRKMEHSLKTAARHIDPKATVLLESVFGQVVEDRTYTEKPVIVEVGPGTEIEHLFRARVFQTEDALEKALSHPERHIGPPPSEIAVAGRMNARGISVFYGATDQQIAIAEVRPPVGSYAAMGKFQITRKLRLLDLYELNAVVVDPRMSMFDPSCASAMTRSQFLGTLAEKLVMPVMPELQDRDYLITQVIADFLATHPTLELDGILFPSAQHALTKRNIPGRNVILFNKASKVAYSDHDFGNTRANLWDVDDDGARFQPMIWTEQDTEPKPPRPPFLIPADRIEPTLELDRESLEIFEIKAIQYGTFSHAVEHKVVSKRDDRKRKY